MKQKGIKKTEELVLGRLMCFILMQTICIPLKKKYITKIFFCHQKFEKNNKKIQKEIYVIYTFVNTYNIKN